MPQDPKIGREILPIPDRLVALTLALTGPCGQRRPDRRAANYDHHVGDLGTAYGGDERDLADRGHEGDE